jgi:acyl-coenzyme A thioesterase PaaI-like protein
MKHVYELVDAAEYERLRTAHEPLTRALRDLVDASVRTGVDALTIDAAQAAIEAVTRELRRAERDTTVTLCHADTGRPLMLANPVVGLRNPLAPPVEIEYRDDGRCVCDFVLGVAYEGPSGHVHGGVSAMVLDQILGEVATEGMKQPRFTGTISVRYLRGTPLGPLRAEAWIERQEGPKTFARGFVADADGITAEAEGVFIEPAWAREAG